MTDTEREKRTTQENIISLDRETATPSECRSHEGREYYSSACDAAKDEKKVNDGNESADQRHNDRKRKMKERKLENRREQ